MTGADLMKIVPVIRKNPFGAGCAIITTLSVLSGLYFWQDSSSVSELHRDTEKAYGVMLETVTIGQTIRAELAHVLEYTKRMESDLLIPETIADNKSYFVGLGDKAKAFVICEQFSPPPLEGGQLYRKIPFNLSVTGTYDQVAAFLQAVETGPRLTAITSLSFRRTGEPGSPFVSLSLSVEQLAKRE